MPVDPITAITTLRSLITSLIESITDRKHAAELREIQQIISSLDGEYFRMRKESLQLETNYAQLQQRVLPLEARVTAADAERDKALAELSKLKAKLSEFTAQEERRSSNRLPDESEKMLVALSGVGRKDEVTRDTLIAHAGLPKARGDYYFDLLTNAKFVRVTHGRMGAGSFWAATPEGRSYLVDNKLI
jgi:hypothetical protein